MFTQQKREDTDGNKIFLEPNSSKKRFKVMLYLKNKKPRMIGKISILKNGDVSYRVWKSTINHYYETSDSRGFNHQLINEVLPIGAKVTVRLMPQGENIKTTREYILKYWHFLHYKKIGFERQIFLKEIYFGL